MSRHRLGVLLVGGMIAVLALLPIAKYIRGRSTPRFTIPNHMSRFRNNTYEILHNHTAPRKTELSDIFFGIKSTGANDEGRLKLLFDTWLDSDKVRKQTYIISDTNKTTNNITSGHLIDTGCEKGHNFEALCCKVGSMFDVYMTLQTRWWCCFDDDDYVNVDNLVTLLQGYNETKHYYIGRESIPTPKTFVEKLASNRTKPSKDQPSRKTVYWFGTGGAGICISRAFAQKMKPYLSAQEFRRTCIRIHQADDVTIGYVAGRLGGDLTKINDMYSHYNKMASLNETQIAKAITLSFKGGNRLSLNNSSFNLKEDPTRFKSLHCQLKPTADICP